MFTSVERVLLFFLLQYWLGTCSQCKRCFAYFHKAMAVHGNNSKVSCKVNSGDTYKLWCIGPQHLRQKLATSYTLGITVSQITIIE